MNATNSIRPLALGVGLIVATVAGLIISIRAVDGLPWERTDQYSAQLENANHLLTGAQVQVTGVHVGNVDAVEVHPDGGARVTFSLRELEQGTVREDARVAVRPRSPLGQQLLILEPGSPDAPPLEPGAEIPIERTGFPTELDEVLDIFDDETVGDTRDLVRALGGGFLGTGPELDRFLEGSPELLDQLGEVSDILVAREESIARLLRSGASLSERLESRAEPIGQLLDDGGRTLGALGQGDALERTLAVAPEGLEESSAALARLASALDPTASALDDVGPGVAALSDSMPQVRDLLRDGVSTFDELTDVAELAPEPLEALQPAIAELRPVLTQLETTVTELAPAIDHLAPYGPEIATWFRRFSSAIGSGDDKSNWTRFLWKFGVETTSNTLPGTPLVNTHPYPEPGEAATMRERYELIDTGEQD